MTPHEVLRPSIRIRACKAAVFGIVSLLLLMASAQGELLAVCGDTILDAGEQCDLGGLNGAPGSCCGSACNYMPSSTVCRTAAGVCDVAETCTGMTDSCPTDQFLPPTFSCRAPAGVCDAEETCTGSSASCPADALAGTSVVCRTAAGVCDVAETCTGMSISCPANGFASPMTVCRTAAGVCDVAETCTGSSSSCPANGFASPMTVCRASAGVCDTAETCPGSSASCPGDAFASSSTICRGAMGDCDIAEACTGSSPSCPMDAQQMDGALCSDDGEFCTGVEVCQGGICQGSPVNCDDNDPCTIDFCNEGEQNCSSFPTPDQETARGPDGLCDTSDDNLSLYGGDEECGTVDDQTGDGVCSGADNCDFAFNPQQQDGDNDAVGDSCDATPCLTQGLYAVSGSALYRLEPAALTFTLAKAGLPADLKDVAVDASGFFAAVTSDSTDSVAVINLFDLMEPVQQFPFDAPWGIDFDGSSFTGYVVEKDLGRIGRFDPFGMDLPPLMTVLTNPTGIDVNAAGTFAFVTEAPGRLQRINTSSGAMTLVTSGLSDPRGVALNAAETHAYVAEAGAGRLSRVNLATGTISIIATGLGAVQDVALNATGSHAYVTVAGAPPGEVLQVELGGMGIVTTLDFSGGMAPPFTAGLALGPRAPVRVSLADNSSGSPPTSVVPLMVEDVTGLEVISLDLTLRYNPDVVGITTIGPGSLTGACTLTTTLTTPGLAILSIFCTDPLAGAGSLAEITFSMSGASGQGTPLDIATSLLNEGSPAHCADDGTLFIPVEINGTILYYRNHLTGTEPSTKPVDSADVELHFAEPALGEGFDPNTLISTPTDCSGDYSLVDLAPVQPYTVLARKTDDFLGAIDPFDAALNAQHVAGQITLTNDQQLAADASGNGTLTSFDSARIAQLSVGLIAQLPVAVNNGSDWAFIPVPQAEPNQSVFDPAPSGGQPGRIDYVPIVESAENQDFRALLYGDVSGNWQPVCPGLLPPGGSAPDASMAPWPGLSFTTLAVPATPGVAGPAAPSLIIPSFTASKGQTVRVPVRAVELPAAISFYMDLRYDPGVLRLVRVESGAATAGRFSLTPNLLEPGRARMALFSATPLAGSDAEIAVAVFEVVGTAGSASRVGLAGWRVNEGRLGASVTEGSIRVLTRRNPPPLPLQ